MKASPRDAGPIDKYVGARLRMRRQALGMSQSRLGEQLGVSFQQLQKYERGANRIGAGRLYRLAKVLDVPVSYFFEGAADEGEPGAKSGAMAMFAGEEPIFRADVAKVAEAFSQLDDPAVRRQVLSLVRSLAKSKIARSGG